MTLPLRPVEQPHAAHAAPVEPPYQWFLLGSLAIAIFGGIAFATAAVIAGVRELDWGARSAALTQAHGQLQLIGFGGLFIIGMTLRILPRVSARPLRGGWLVWPTLLLVAGAMVLRALAQLDDSQNALRDATLAGSAALFLLGAAAFTTLVLGTTLRRNAEATEIFFTIGAVFLAASAVLNAAIAIEMVRDSRVLADAGKQAPLVFMEEYGFTLAFLAGVATRALPPFSGRPRGERSSRAVAAGLALGVALFAGAALAIEYGDRSETLARIAAAGLIVSAVSFAGIVWLTGVLHPRANRIAQASRTQFWFVRTAMAWLLAGSVLMAWYGLRAFADGRLPDQFAIDALRHTFALGVLTMMILGMALLIVPEFAARRMHHAHDTPWIWAMLVAANAAVVLRIWPSLEGVDWLESTRYSPMAWAGVLSEAVLITFAFMFVQSWSERSGWRRPPAS